MPECPNCGQSNPDIARFCLACGSPLAAREAVSAEERKVVTVLFCDLVGFTAMSERADPEDVRAMLRPYHARVRQEIERFGGTVEKFIGDAVMAVFGAPAAHEDDAERAVRAGLRILDAIAGMHASRPGPSLAVRIGINTGEAVVSRARGQLEQEGIAIGDVVNTASRIQTSAPIGAVVVGESTFRITDQRFDYERLDPVMVKGKSEPVAMWRATGLRPEPAADADVGRSTPFVDREDEIDLLLRSFARALRERSVQLLTLVGEPGVGKSRLVREFFRRLDEVAGSATRRTGRCLPYGDGITFWPLGEIVKAEAAILESDPPEVVRDKLEAAVRRLVPEGPEQEWLRARVAPLVGMAPPDEAEAKPAEAFAAWRVFLEAVATPAPLVLVFEDLHWADRAMVEFLEHLVDWSNDVPMLVVCTARPELFERHPAWGGGKRNSTTISLTPLPEAEIRGLVASLLPEGSAPQVHELVLERAGGNPLYAEEFTRMLADRGVAKGGGTDYPHSIHAIIAARLDTLPPDRKELLQDASVVGRVFWSGAVAAMAGLAEGEARERLHELVRKEFVRPVRTSSMKDQAEYTFWHGLVADVAYSEIPRAGRARKHRQMAAWIEASSGERVADHAELIAHHYRQALELAQATGDLGAVPGLQELAGRYLEIAGDRLMGLDPRKASEHYADAILLLPPGSDRRAPLMVRMAEAAQRTGRFDEAERTYREAVAELLSRGDARRAGAAMVKLQNLHWHRGETARGREVLNEAIAVLEREEPGPELAAAYTEMAGDKIVLGLYDDALSWAKRALGLIEMVGAQDQAPSALTVQGISRWYLGDPTGIDDLRAALDQAVALGLGREAARLQSILGEFLWVTEGPDVALGAFEVAIDMAERRGNADLAMAFLAEKLDPLFDLGRWDELLSVADELGEWARTTGEGYFSVAASTRRAHVELCRGEVDRAAGLAMTFLPAARQIRDPQVLVDALAVAAVIEHAAGKPAGAVELLEEFERVTSDRPTWFGANHIAEIVRTCVAVGAQPMAERLLAGLPAHARRHTLGVLTARAVLEEARGEIEGALATYEQAAEGWKDFGFVLERGRTILGAGRCMVRLANAQAADRLADARSVFVSLGAPPLVAEADAWLAQAPARIS